MLPYPQTPELSCIKTQRVEKQGKTRPGSVWFCEINIIVVEYMYMKIHHKATKRKPRERHVFMNSEYTTILYDYTVSHSHFYNRTSSAQHVEQLDI